MDLKMKFEWDNASKMKSKSYTCGYCGNSLASEVGFQGKVNWQDKWRHSHIYICHFCSRPTYFDTRGDQFPGMAFGGDVADVSDATVHALYNEARNATSANCFTAAVLCCRKLLMHIAVSKGAKKNQSFAEYVDHLSQNNYVPPDAQEWVDHIRKRGNEANHEISIMTREDAEELIAFSEMLLKIIFEFPATVKKKYVPTAKGGTQQ